MKFSLFTNYGALNSKPIFAAFDASLRKQNYKVLYNDYNADVAVIWSVLWNGRMQYNSQVWKHFKLQNKPVIVLEVGGIKRNVTWKVGLNGINRLGILGPKNQTDARAKQLNLELKPYQQNNNKILIACQHDKSQQWENMPAITVWLDNTIKEIRKYSNKEIIIRPHPRCPINFKNTYTDVVIQNPVKLQNTYDDFDLFYKDIHCVINWSSNPGVQAILNGIPVFVGPNSLAYEVSNTDYKNIDSPELFDREQWKNDLAHTEYTVEEIRNGIPLKFLTNFI